MLAAMSAGSPFALRLFPHIEQGPALLEQDFQMPAHIKKSSKRPAEDEQDYEPSTSTQGLPERVTRSTSKSGKGKGKGKGKALVTQMFPVLPLFPQTLPKGSSVHSVDIQLTSIPT